MALKDPSEKWVSCSQCRETVLKEISSRPLKMYKFSLSWKYDIRVLSTPPIIQRINDETTGLYARVKEIDSSGAM